MNKKIVISSVLALLGPVLAFAQTSSAIPQNGITLMSVIDTVIWYLNEALLLLIALAVVSFVYNVIKYFIRADADRTEAGKYVMYSLIGFFVILSVWGLVNILQNTFGLKDSSISNAPTWDSINTIFPK